MAFLLYVAAGFAAGLLGGMGMGGGTILIPALTIFLGVSQHVAQATNVVAFLPMAAFALAEHKKQGLLKTGGLAQVIIPAVIATVFAGMLMAALPGEMLRKLFGTFLIILAVKEAFVLKESVQSRAKNKGKANAEERAE